MVAWTTLGHGDPNASGERGRYLSLNRRVLVDFRVCKKRTHGRV